MRFEPAFFDELRADFNSIEPGVRGALTCNRGSLSEDRLLRLIAHPNDHSISDFELPMKRDFKKRDDIDHGSAGVAMNAISKGEVAYCVLAGGMGTRLSGNGCKALTSIPTLGMSFLGYKVCRSPAHIGGKTYIPKVWIMTSPSNRSKIEQHLTSLVVTGLHDIQIFDQCESYSLRPDYRVIFEQPGIPCVYPTGSGDLPDALVDTTLFESFVNSGGKYIIVSNVDNIAADIDPRLLGHHIESNCSITCEIVERKKTDETQTLVCSNTLQLIDSERLVNVPTAGLKYSWSGTMIINVDVLIRSLKMEWTYHRLQKQINNKVVIQFERSLSQLTEWEKTQYVFSPREERYASVKVEKDLAGLTKLFNVT